MLTPEKSVQNMNGMTNSVDPDQTASDCLAKK